MGLCVSGADVTSWSSLTYYLPLPGARRAPTWRLHLPRLFITTVVHTPSPRGPLLIRVTVVTTEASNASHRQGTVYYPSSATSADRTSALTRLARHPEHTRGGTHPAHNTGHRTQPDDGRLASHVRRDEASPRQGPADGPAHAREVPQGYAQHTGLGIYIQY